jgi:cytokinesis protein
MSGHFLSRQDHITPAPSLGLSVVRPKKKLKALHWEKVDSPLTTHWAAHTPSAEEREEKYLELSRKGILDEVEKLFMAKEIKLIGQGSAKKDDKKQIISNDLRKAFGESPPRYRHWDRWQMLTMSRNRPRQVFAVLCRKGGTDDHPLRHRCT